MSKMMNSPITMTPPVADTKSTSDLLDDLVDLLSATDLERLSPCTTLALASLTVLAGRVDEPLVQKALVIAKGRGNDELASLYRKALGR